MMDTSVATSVKQKKYWFMEPMNGLPKEAEARLRTNSDRKLQQYANQFKNMPARVPGNFYANTDVRTLYKRLITFCHKQCLPDELVLELIPSIVNYMKCGYFRPLVFIGDRGCGKTTTSKLIFEQILGIGSWVVKIPQADTSHGLCGETSTFSGGDIGNFAEGLIHNNNLIVGFVMDEVDKCPEPVTRASITNELLSACDESIADLRDNYLGFKLPSLKHCPIIMTANDESKVNPILLDRCTVIHFPNASLERLEQIMMKYTRKKLETEVFSMVDVDYSLLRKTSERLLHNNIVSIRRHQQCIETALGYALAEVMRTDADRIDLSEDLLLRAERTIIGSRERRKVGFEA